MALDATAGFCTLLSSGPETSYADCVARLQANASDAAAVLHEIALNPAIPASARVSAARSILENATKAAELDTVTERMADLERDLGEMRQIAEDARLQAQQARGGDTR